MPANVADSPYSMYTTSELSTESSLSTDSLGDSLSLRLIIIDSDDEEPPMSPKVSWNPGRKGRPVGSKPVSHENLMHAASLPTGPDTPVSREWACQPQVTMRLAGHGDGFYVIMNGHIMGVFNSWYCKEMDALVTWDETWSNQEIGYPADCHSNQSWYGPEWVRSQRHITAKFYWVVVKGHIPGLYNTFDKAVLGAGDGMCEVVVTQDEDIASRLFDDFTSSEDVVSISITWHRWKPGLEYSSFLMQTDPFKR
ncbi:hypothetical protein ARMGADRAFT_1029446 [Armillaria gallica]|uniref:Uncharacterized protein n=1 Tax=Armillaria gallica TaxID=47427 RepID=A0A2H3E3Q2_ARMGA|nr:hypothetical protein ARMGADRAFT_1029446 [Armillaria gallica]